jgi:DMSO/TMAO reductase YedYZ molybdopterin-dependent catalytic subunit
MTTAQEASAKREAARGHDSQLEVIRHDPYNAETPERALVQAMTPTPNAYIRTNFGVVAPATPYAIEVGGAVDRPFTLTLDALRRMPQRAVTATMECAGNDRLGMFPLPVGEPWRHGALSTLAWSGVPLVHVLDMVGVAPDAVEVLVTAADAGPRDDADGEVRFARSLPLADARRLDTLLALEMNGAPLTPDHGAPVRLAVPGWYGMASVKWVTRIDVLREPFTGYFQRQRYVYDQPEGITPVDRMRVKSIITTPTDNATTARVVQVRGWAWSGDGDITRVDLGVDGGDAWIAATLGTPSSSFAWTPWSVELELPRPGRFVLRSRATDSSGATQPDRVRWNRLGYGNNAIRHIVINAV